MAIHLIDPVQLLTMSLKKWLIKPTDTYSATLAQWYTNTINSNKNTRQNKHIQKSQNRLQKPIKWIWSDQIAGSIKLLY
jgi:hypothetical protein